MNSKDFLHEGIAEDAHQMHMDHEVQMAREELYHAAEHAIALHKMLQHVSEQQGLEGWVSAKITLANDYLNTVREYMEYQLMTQDSTPTDMSQEEPIDERNSIVTKLAKNQLRGHYRHGVRENASGGASSAGSVATVVKGGSGKTNLLGGPEWNGPNPFKKTIKKRAAK